MGGPLVALVVGLGLQPGSDQPPGLVDGAAQLGGRVEIEVAQDARSPIAALLSMTGMLGSYDNTIPPPSSILITDTSDRMRFRRIGIGIVGEVRLPVGRAVRLALGGGPSIIHSELTAEGTPTLFPIPTDYYRATDTSVGAEVRGGIDMRVDDKALIGARAGWIWYDARFDQERGGPLGGPWFELRIELELRMF